MFCSRTSCSKSPLRLKFKKFASTPTVVHHTETSVKSLVQVDDPICIGGQIQVDNLVTALGQWLTTMVTEVIGRDTIVFFWTPVWRTPRGFISMPKEGSFSGARHRMVSSPRKKHHIARSGQQEQQRAKTGQDTAQQVSSRRGEGAGHTSPKTSTLCHQALLKGTGKSHENRCKESGETDQVVVHNKNLEFKDGTRSKQSEHSMGGQTQTGQDVAKGGGVQLVDSSFCQELCLSSYAWTLTKEMMAEQPNRSPRRCIGSDTFGNQVYVDTAEGKRRYIPSGDCQDRSIQQTSVQSAQEEKTC